MAVQIQVQLQLLMVLMVILQQHQMEQDMLKLVVIQMLEQFSLIVKIIRTGLNFNLSLIHI